MRRFFLLMALCAAGVVAISPLLGQDDKNPAANVADRSSTIRITAMKLYWVGPVVYVKIETNQGVEGIGVKDDVFPQRIHEPIRLGPLSEYSLPREQVANERGLAGLGKPQDADALHGRVR